MYRHNQKQLEFEIFVLPFGGHLRSHNRWVRWAKFIPWDEFEGDYRKAASRSSYGPPAKSVRVALGALIIKKRLGTSDEETVEQIRENPYLQYFLGYKEYKDEPPFDPSLFVHFRKRFHKKTLSRINALIARKALDEENKKTASKSSKKDDDEPGRGPGSNLGKLLVDATCTPADITFPTDLKFLDRISWDAYNECGDLIGQIESYRNRYGYYPESVHADQIYRTRDNRNYCKRHGIRLSVHRGEAT